MTPYPGESIGCPDAWSSGAAGWDLYRSIWWRGGAYDGAPSATLSAGVEWRAWAYHYAATYMQAADDDTPLEVSWVLEVVGGSGTVDVYDFDDAAFAEDTTHTGHTYLGTLTISGPGTYLMPTASFTRPTLRTAGSTGGALEVRLVGASGSVDVQQVKLRAWPVGGPLGGWSGDYIQAATAAPLTFLRQVIGLPSGSPTTYPTQAAFRSALTGLTVVTDTTPTTAAGIVGATMNAVYNHPSGTTEVSGGPGLVYFKATTGNYDPPGTEGVDWVRAPEEVAGDYLHVVDAPDNGLIVWVQQVASAFNAAQVFGSDGVTYYYSEGSAHLTIAPVAAPLAIGDPVYPLLGTGTPVQSYAGHGVSPVASYTEDATMPAGLQAEQLYRLLMWHDGHLADIDLPDRGVDFSGGGSAVTLQRGKETGTLDPLAAQWQPSPYRYWSPTAVVVTESHLRQVHRDDGFGITPRRARGASSRAATNRARAYD